MNLIKTIKKFVTGTDKYFDIYECTVDEVESYTSDSGKSMIRIKVNEIEYSGLYNKWVYEYLCENEGTSSFVVMWRAPKGKPMLAYLKELWQNHLNGVNDGEVSSESDAYSPSGESFVYLWINKDTDRKYIGKHKGTTDDGYVCSSDSMLEEYNDCPSRFIRTILAYGTDQEMHELETMLLLQLKASKSELFYNLSNNLRKD
jgi:hypothetical protein